MTLILSYRRGEKFDNIIRAAISVFAKYGYHQAQVSRIAEEAGVAAGTIYLYFENKQDLLISVFRERFGQIVEHSKRQLEELSSPLDKLYRLVYSHYATLAQDPEFATVTQIELRQSDPVIRTGISTVMRSYFEIIDGVVALGQSQGQFDPSLDRRLMRNMIFGTLDQTATAWVLSGMKYDLLSQVEPTYRLLLYGMAGGVRAIEGGGALRTS